jgi:hypothetical protein
LKKGIRPLVTLKKPQHHGSIKDKEMELHHPWLKVRNILLTLKAYITSGRSI